MLFYFTHVYYLDTDIVYRNWVFKKYAWSKSEIAQPTYSSPT